jgi:hypothetical protein
MGENENILRGILEEDLMKAVRMLGPCTNDSLKIREVVLYVKGIGPVRFTCARSHDERSGDLYYWLCKRAVLN